MQTYQRLFYNEMHLRYHKYVAILHPPSSMVWMGGVFVTETNLKADMLFVISQ